MAAIVRAEATAVGAAVHTPAATMRVVALRVVLVPFLASRALFALITVTLPWWAALLHVPQAAPLTQDGLLAQRWFQWDALWYMRVATDGYRAAPYAHQHLNLAFFPLYPLLLHLWFALWPWSRVLAAMLCANLCALIASYYLYRLVARELGDAVATRTLWLLAFFPTSFFFFAGYSEGLFLLCLVLCFYHLRLRRWWLAGLWGALATLTRSLGIVLVVPFLIAWLEAHPDLLSRVGAGSPWRRRRQRVETRGWARHDVLPGLKSGVSSRVPGRRRPSARRAWWGRDRATIAAVALMPMSLLAFMAYFWIRFGNPVAFSTSQRSWHRAWAWPWQTLWAALARPLAGFPHLKPEQLHAGLDTLWAIVFLALAVYAWRGFSRRYAGFLLLFWIVVLCTPALLPGAIDPLISLPRFLVCAFPYLVFLASTPRRTHVALALSVPLLIFNVGTFISGGWVA